MRGRIIILVVLIIIVAIVAVAALVLAGGGDSGEEAATLEATVDLNLSQADRDATAAAATAQAGDTGGPAPAETPLPVDLAPVVIAQQDLPRGFRLTPEFLSGPSPAVAVVFWPVGSVPQNSYSAVEDLENLLVRSDIPRESPVLSTQLVADMTALAKVGSDASLLLPPGLVAISMPLDPSGVGSVAYGLQPGDYVDVLLSFLFIEVDETFQSRQPNKISVITRTEEGQLSFGVPLEGRPEPSTLSSLGVLVSPSEQQRPRLVTQRTVERAYVLYVGYFPPDGKIVGVMTPTPFDTPTPAPVVEEEGAPQQPTPTSALPTPTEFLPVIITLGVEPQDALVLTWAIDAQIPVTFALRSATDTGSVPTTAVTLQYLIENYAIPQPPILPFALEPPIRSLRSVQLEVFRTFTFDETGRPTTQQTPQGQ